MHLFQKARPVQDLQRDLPPGYSQLIARLMEKDPNRRFSSWQEAKDALNHTKSGTGDALPTDIQQLLQQAEAKHDQQERERLAQAKASAEREEKFRLDYYMEAQLAEELQRVVVEFNTHSSIAKVTSTIKQQGGIPSEPSLDGSRLQVASHGTITFESFPVEPAMNLSVGHVRRAVTAKLRQDNGLHFLLCRANQDDQYGHWEVANVVVSGFIQPGATNEHRRLLPFSMRDITHIASADRAMHIYDVSFSKDIRKAITDFMADVIRQ